MALFFGALNLAYLVAAFLGALRWPRMAGAMVALIILRSLLLATLEAPEPRYTLECFPVVIVLAACYFTTWLVPGGGLELEDIGCQRLCCSECSCRSPCADRR